MTTERDARTRIVLSWLREDAREDAERVLLSALDEVDTTPQRRPWWSAWRNNPLSTYAKLIAAAAAILVVAVVGYQFLPGGSLGPGSPTAAPSPTPSPLAKGTFKSHGVTIEMDATGDGADVSGTLKATDDGGGTWSVDLQCTQTKGGLVFIAGEITASTQEGFPVGSDTAMIFQPGSPPKAIIWVPGEDVPAATCMAFVDGLPIKDDAPDAAGFEPIVGTLDLRT